MDYVTRQFINLTKKFRKELRRALQQQTDAIRDATKAARENKQYPLPVPLPIVAELQVPEAKETERSKREDRAFGVQVWLAVVTTLTFLAAGIYAGIAANQSSTMNNTYGEIQKQTTMMRQQLVGTQAAILYMPEPRWDNMKQELVFTIGNNGMLIGVLKNFDATIQKKSLPAQRPIGKPISIYVSNRPIQKGGTETIDQALPWKLPEVKDVALWPGKEFVTVDGSFTYDNGFGEPLTQRFCFLWMAPWSLTMPAPMTGGWGGGAWAWGGGKEPCRKVQDMENEFLRIKEHIKESSTPQKH
ncbi:MAG: hypothetical protein WCA76_02125 [Candidatus Sulfotelmatobacter sp.]|jgi:hypothetical protein